MNYIPNTTRDCKKAFSRAYHAVIKANYDNQMLPAAEGSFPLEPQQDMWFETLSISSDFHDSRFATVGQSKGLQPLVTMGIYGFKEYR
jgi:hypothetical protein